MGPLEGLSLTAMQKVFDTNFFGAVRLVKAVLPGMKRRRQGHIVVVSSVMGLQGKLWTPTLRILTVSDPPQLDGKKVLVHVASEPVLRRILKLGRKSSGID